VRAGLAGVQWPGRLEVLGDAPLLVLDGAHNADGAAALAAALPRLVGGRPIHLLFAVMRDKAWRPMVERLAPLCRSVVVTEVLPSRGAAAEPVAAAFRAVCQATAEPDLERAWRVVRERAGRDGVIVAAGSLFLIGALRERGLGRAAGVAATAGAVSP
jgi:dihydrofolate synthase/folylpolyglutamate synthase